MRSQLAGFLYRHRGIEGLIYVLPFAALWGIFLAWPVGYGIYLSLFEWSPMKGSRFVGFHNYIALFRDARFLNALANTFEFAAMAVPLILGLGLVFALMLWSWGRTRRGVGFIQAVLFFPYLLTVSTVAITWKWMFDPDFGLVTHMFKALKVAAPVFLTEPAWALPAIAFATAWWLAGYRMVVFQAGLGEIPQELFEVASIDGAGFHQQLLRIILPLLKPSLLFSLVLTLISAFRTFGQVLMMTEGGPGRSTEVLALYLYRTAFEYFDIGKAAASGVVMLVLMLILTLIGVKVLGLRSELG
jgi:ABC-type sugar transport system permease subunit